ncbi:PAS domain S-box protein [Herbaspirillum sp. ST 5-3]|uniref:PAS domain S-box protein n=1 Tax=Oxalobacteraceae TaxID=75682 RepID=UPI0010A3366D|nr:PAS domain S-box protein [Herbaspirillum sp. ST 5-3]
MQFPISFPSAVWAIFSAKLGVARRCWPCAVDHALSSLRAKLAMTIAIILLPAVALIWYLGSELHQHQMRLVTLNMEQVLDAINASQLRSMDGAAQLLKLMERIPSIRERRDGYCAFMRELLEHNSHYENLGMTDASGNMLCTAVPMDKAINVSDRLWFRRAIETRELSTGTYHISRLSGYRPVTVLSMPIMDAQQRIKSVLFVTVDVAANIAKAVAERRLPASTYVVLFRPGKGGWATAMVPMVWSSMSPAEMANLPVTPESRESTWPDDERRLWAFSALPRAVDKGPTTLGVGIPAGEFAKMNGMFFTMVTAICMSGAVVLLLAWVSYRRFILHKTDRLVEAARRIGEGDWDARSGIGHGSGEFGILARALDEMAEAVRRREQEITWRQYALDQHAIVSISDVEGRITFINDKFCEISGYSREELIGQNHRILNSGRNPTGLFEDMWHTISAGKVWQGVICNLHKGGGHYWVTSTIVPRLDESGMPFGYISIRTEITPLVKAEEALKRSEEMYRLLAENTQDVVSLHDRAGALVYVSPACARVLGYDYPEMRGAVPWPLIHPKDIDTVMQELFDPVLNGAHHASAVFRMRHCSGNYLWTEVTATPVLDADGRLTHVQSTLRDITLRKEAEDNLRLHDMAIQSSLTGIMLFSSERGNPIVYVNPACETITGRSAEDFAGGNVQCLFDQIEGGENLAKIRAALDRGMEGRALIRFLRRDGTARWADCSVAPVRDGDETVTHFVLAFNDMTERMLVLEDMQRAKEESDKANRAKSDFLSRMTHELRTPLNFILGFAQLLETRPEQLTEMQLDGVRRIIRSGWHLRELIDEILDLSRIDAGKLEIQPEDVEIAPLLCECISVVELMATERCIRIEPVSAQSGATLVKADRTRLKQVLLNLLSNAIKFNCEGGLVRVEYLHAASGAVRITVSDTGPGIDLARQGELFQPFSRLDADRAEIPGTGIGLAISQRFMQLMGGRIGVRSERGKGSAFWIELPSAENACLLI